MIVTVNSTGAQNIDSAGRGEKLTDIRFMTYWLAGCMAIVAIMSMIFLPTTHSSNDRSRWGTVWSLTHGKGYVVDKAPYEGVDRVMRDGHLYSSKPPLFPTIVAGLAWLIRLVTGWDLPRDAFAVTSVILILINIIPYSIVILLYGRLLEQWNCDNHTALLCLLTAAGGTYLTAYLVTLNNHTIGACGCFFTLYCLHRIIYDKLILWKYFLGAGFFAAWTVCNELPAGLFGVIVFALLFRISRENTLKVFVPAALLVFAAYLYTTFLATGGLTPNYLNGSLYRYEGSYWLDPKGIDAAQEPKWIYLLNTLVGHHGIFSLTPIFLFALAGFCIDKPRRTLHSLTLWSGLALLVFVVARTNNYGGGCEGARWTFWLIPGLLLALPSAFQKLSSLAWFRPTVYAALSISMLSTFLAMTGDRGPWGTSLIHAFMRAQGIVDY